MAGKEFNSGPPRTNRNKRNVLIGTAGRNSSGIFFKLELCHCFRPLAKSHVKI